MKKFMIVFLFVLMGCVSSKPIPIQAEQSFNNYTEVKKQYFILLSDRQYEKVFALFSDRLQNKFGGLDNFIKLNEIIISDWKAKGITEEVVKDSIEVDGNIVSFKIIQRKEGSAFVKIISMKAYIPMLGDKIDWIIPLKTRDKIEIKWEM